jgi:PAS domain S-box-containing protein
VRNRKSDTKPITGNLSASRYKALLEHAYDGVVLYDGQGVVQFASASVKRVGGFTPFDLIGKKGDHFIHPSEREAARDAFRKVLISQGKSISLTQRFITKKGTYIWCEYTLTNLLHNPEVRGIVSNFRNVHDRVEAINRAAESQRVFSLLSENISDGIFLGIPQRKFQFVNKAFLQITGYTSINDLNSIKPHQLFAERKVWNRIRQLKAPGSIKSIEALFKKKNGEIFWGLISLSVFRDSEGQSFFVGSVRDISQQKEAESKLKTTEHLLSSINLNITEGLYRNVPGKQFVYTNPAFLNMFGFKSLDELNKLKPRQLYADRKQYEKVRTELARHGQVQNIEALFRKSNGETFWGSVSSILIKQKRGKGPIIDGAIRDITRQKEYEMRLQESQSFLTNVMNTVAAPIFVKDKHHRWIMFNEAFCSFMNRSTKELQNKTDKDFLPEKECKVFWKVDNEVLRTGAVVLNRETVTTKRGNTRHLLTFKSRYINEKGERFVIGFIMDVTEIQKVEDEILKLNANLRGIMESTRESIYALDRNYCYTAFNRNHAQMARLLYGVDIHVGDKKLNFIKGTKEEKWLLPELRKAMRGENHISLHQIDHSKYKRRWIQTTYNPIFNKQSEVDGVAVFVSDITEMMDTQQALSHSNATLHGVLQSTTDRIIALDDKLNYVLFNESHVQNIKRIAGTEIRPGDSFIKNLPKPIVQKALPHLKRALKGKPVLIELGMRETFVEALINPIRDSSNKVIGVTLFVRDITQRKRTEQKLRVLNETLIHQNQQLAAQEEELKATLEELSERNFELDQIMYKTSHDLRSPLSSILGLVNLARMDTEGSQRDYLEKIEGRIKKLDEFIKSMLNYARVSRDETGYEEVDLEAVTRECIQELEYLENFSAVRVVRNFTGTEIPFVNDPVRVKIVLGNIISNAYKYYNPQVRSTLRITVNITPQQAIIVIKDNGIGIREEYTDRIFDMFYRATENSQGSGLGMYIVKQAVEKLNGKIEVKSKFGKGTTITVALPNHRKRSKERS